MVIAGKQANGQLESKWHICALTMLAQQGDQGAIVAPNNVFHRWRSDLCNGFLLLNVVEDDGGRRTEDEAGGSTVEDLVGLYGRLDRFHDGV